MEKEIRFEVGEGVLSVQSEEQRDYWNTINVSLPTTTKKVECNGVWDDRSIFECDGWQLEIPTGFLVRLIESTRDIVEKNESWWRDGELREKLFAALGNGRKDPLQSLIVETPQSFVMRRLDGRSKRKPRVTCGKCGFKARGRAGLSAHERFKHNEIVQGIQTKL